MRSSNSTRRRDTDHVRQRLGTMVRSEQADEEVVETPTWLDPDDSDEGSSWRVDRFRDARIDPGRRGMLALAAVGVVVAVVAAFVVMRDRPQSHPAPPVASVAVETPSSGPPPPVAELVVSVVGLVQVNGLVRLPPGSRVADAIAAAGGPKEGADLLSLNMAQRLADGDQILVGIVAPGGGPPILGSATVPASGATDSGQPGAKLNLNTATEAELDTLPGVGPVTAAAIVAWRTTNGKFTDIEQLGEVDGIGPSRLAKLRDLVTL